MKRSSISFIEVSPELWTKFPADRPFSALAGDAMAGERRIQKGVNLGRERTRYTQLCSWIEASALRLFYEGKITNSLVLYDSEQGEPASDYIRLVEFLQSQPDIFEWVNRRMPKVAPATRKPSFLEKLKSSLGVAAKADDPLETNRLQATGRSLHTRTIGKTFFAPGEDVLEQHALFARTSIERLQFSVSNISDDKLAPYASLAAQKAKFYANASKRKCGVVEVLVMAAS